MGDRLDDVPNMAIFCDFENVAIGAREARYDEFEIHLVLERLLDKGKIVVKKAYADWERYKGYRRALHEAAFELIEIPHVSYSGKNSADIRLVVDALDLCYVKQHVDIFVIVSGDSDFSPLVSKLRENNKRVIGLGVKSSTSDLLIENCDEFIYYDDLVRERAHARRTSPGQSRAPKASGPKGAAPQERTKPRPQSEERAQLTLGAPSAAGAAAGATVAGVASTSAAGASAGAASTGAASTGAVAAAGNGGTGTSSSVASGESEVPVEQRQLEALEMVMDVVEGLFQDREGNVWGSLVKQTLKRKRPNFSERFHGYRTFNDLLEDAGKRGLLEVHLDEKSNGYVVSAFGPKA